VFFGTGREELHVHRAGSAMKLTLGVLAFGAWTTWLLYAGLNRLFVSTLPFHAFEEASLLELTAVVTLSPATWVALLVVGLGAGLFWLAGRRSALSPSRLEPLLNSSFGMEPVNRLIVRSTYGLADRLSLTQTGQLNWNILGIIAGLLVVLLLLWMGA
jgi:hypothetical protein